LTPNGSHLIASFYPNSVYFYSYNNITAVFTLLFQNNILPIISSVGIYCNYGEMFSIATGGYSSSMVFFDLAYIYFVCTVAYCDQCSFIGICKKCSTGFELYNTQCICPANQTLNGGVCISCSIPLCDYCTSANVCSSCSNGFTLSGNNC
jgi:hypothetical protein